MPARRISQEERDIREGIRERYGEYLSPSEVGQLLGLNRTAMYEYVKGLPATMVGKRKRYAASAIARRLHEDTLY